MAQLVVRGKINRVIKRRAPRPGGGKWNGALGADRASAATYAPGIDLRLVERMPQTAYRVREILQKIDVDVEADDKGFILRAHDIFQERRAHFLFHVKHALLAPAGIDEDTERQRKIGFGLEVFDGLLFTVFKDVELLFGQIGNQGAVLVFDVEKELNDFDVDLESSRGVVLRGIVRRRVVGNVLGRGVGGWRIGSLRGILSQCGLGHQKDGQEKDG